MKFSEVFCRHRGKIADKWEGYLGIYDNILCGKSEDCLNILEIGVNNGGSLEVFAEYFCKARLVIGVDINPLCSTIPFADQRIQIIIGDSNDKGTKQLLRQRSESFDLIVDDGSHQSKDIIATFLNLVGLLSPGGTYIIEDLCCSYWHEFGGGVNTDASAIGFFKRLVDVVNFEHWNSSYTIVDYLSDSGFDDVSADALASLSAIRSICFFNSVCVIDFARISSESSIGKRICRGSQALAGCVPINRQSIKDVGTDQSGNPFNVSLTSFIPPC